MAESGLKLLADEPEGLRLIAAAMQDALVRPQDILFDGNARSFGLETNRFQWEKASRRPPWFRSRAVLAFSGVLAARSRNMPKGVDDVLGLLDLQFLPAADPPGGELRLVFAHTAPKRAEVRLTVECVDVIMMDTGPVWPTRRKPDHIAAAGVRR